MLYRVHYFVGGAVTGTDTQHDITFEDAKELALKAVQAQHADRAEVRDDRGKLLFQHPRTMSPAHIN